MAKVIFVCVTGALMWNLSLHFLSSMQLSINMSTYHWDHPTGPDAVTHTHSHQVLVVGILAPPHQHLMAHEVGLLIDHEEATLHPAGVTPA